MKKRLPVLLSALLTVQLITAAFAVTAGAENSDYTENGVRYKLLSDKTAAVVGADENVSQITLSETLKNGYNVEMIESKAFQGNLDLVTFVCNADIKSVGDYAFESCAHLETAEFNGNVKTVGDSAFAVCPMLSKVGFPDSVTSLGDGVFLMDTRLSSFEFPSSLTSLGEFAFALSGIRKADLNCGITDLSDRAFYKCVDLTQATLPSSVVTIGDCAFDSCENLSSVKIPETVDVIGRCAFASTLISNISLNCSEIGKAAFRNCYEMQNITFSDNLKSIASQAFSNATVEKLELPDNAVLEEGALAELNANEFSVSDTNDKYTVRDGVLFSKDMKTLIAYPVRDDSEKSVYTVPDGVEVIAPHAFDTSWSLTEIRLPDSVKEIGSFAFYQSGIKKMTLPDSVKKIDEYTFSCCQSLESLDLGNVEEIGAYAFTNCSDITLKLPETLKDIDPLVFCDSEIRPEGTGSFGTVDGVLFKDNGKTLVFYPKYLTDEVYTIPEGTQKVGDYAFSSNGSVKRVNIPDSLSEIGEYGVGYSINNFTGEYLSVLTDGFVIIGNAGEGVKRYAADNNIGVFTSAGFSQNITETSLAGGETARFVVNNTDIGDVVYTSNDDRIASISDNGTITGCRKGTTYVTAAVGTTYFKCKVNVTSDSSIPYRGFDESKYLKVDQASYEKWVEDYRANNPYLTENFRAPSSSNAVSAYQSQSYFEAMFGADATDSHYHDTGISMFGEGFEKMIRALSHACDAELSRYHNTDDMLLYSGADSYTTSLAAQGKPATVKNMRSSIGTSFTYPLFTSTTLDEIVSHRFYGGQDGVLMMIYADKKALDNHHSGYIGAYHGDIEYELLLSHGAKYEVIDAGVRYVSKEGFREDDEKLDTYERYVKLKLLNDTPDEADTETDRDSDTSSKNNDSKQSSSAVSSKGSDSKQSSSAVSSKDSDSKQSGSAVSSKGNDSGKSGSAVSSKGNNSAKTSAAASKKTASNVSSETKNTRKIFTGDNTGYTVVTMALVMAAAFAVVMLQRKKED